jgi:hypothetical protein
LEAGQFQVGQASAATSDDLCAYDKVQSRCCARREDGKICAPLLRLLRRRRSRSSLRRVLNTWSFTKGGHDLPSLSRLSTFPRVEKIWLAFGAATLMFSPA